MSIIPNIYVSFYHFSILEISEFQNLVGGFIEMVDSLAKQVEREKMKVRIIICYYIIITVQYRI